MLLVFYFVDVVDHTDVRFRFVADLRNLLGQVSEVTCALALYHLLVHNLLLLDTLAVLHELVV